MTTGRRKHFITIETDGVPIIGGEPPLPVTVQDAIECLLTSLEEVVRGFDGSATMSKAAASAAHAAGNLREWDRREGDGDEDLSRRAATISAALWDEAVETGSIG